MNVLGLTATISWNTAAALVQNGRLVAAAEEERFNRINQAPRMPPVKAAEFCLKHACLQAADVDCIAVGFAAPFKYALLRSFGTLRAMETNNFLMTFPSVAEYLVQEFKLRSDLDKAMPGLARKPWIYLRHHLAHAASAFRAAGFEECNVLTVDGNGEDDSGLSGVFRNGKLQVHERRTVHESLGGFYSNATDLLGFVRHVDEGKTMGLAAYGKPCYEVAGVRVNSSNYKIDRWYNYSGFWKEFGFRRHPGEDLTDQHRDLAASVQRKLEDAGAALARGLYERSGIRKVCLAGGVALNCDMNARILALDCVDEVFVQPAAHDAGTALGAALEVAARVGEPGGFVMDHAFWGPEYGSREIELALTEAGVMFEKPQDIEQTVAELLAAGMIVGWFQGRMEIGPRALGARSILANPSMPEMRDKVNDQVKHRERWRPFAPSMLEEAAGELVFDAKPSPFMLLTFTVRPEWRERLIAATHVDHTVRSQTVTEQAHPRYYRLIKKFQAITGIPAVLNTSFNDRGEPIVMSPKDALRTFFSTGMEYLAIGDYLVYKRPRPSG